MVTGTPRMIEHGTSRTGRWLRERRTRMAFWIAAIEAIVVAVAHDVTSWMVFGLAVVALAVYVFVGRDSRSDTVRQGSWIFAASQLLAVVAAIVVFVFFWAAVIAVVIFAVVALLFVLRDRR